MYTMTEEQARAYILAGFFPRRDDVTAITDLQDAYGHLSVHFVEQMLDDLDTAENAERLYRLIWVDKDVDRMVRQSQNRKNQTFKRDVLRSKLMRLISQNEQTASTLEDLGNMKATSNLRKKIAAWAEIGHTLGILTRYEYARIYENQIM